MAIDFEKVTYVDGKTVIGAENLNDIQDAILDLDSNKVEEEQGKGLSTNDYSNEDKTKVNTALQPSVLENYRTAAEQNEIDKAQDDEIDDLKSAKAPVIIDTASGTIASFEDGADSMPLKELTVNIEPVQDLHGQDAPYPAGGGKQLFDKDNLTALDNAYLSNMTLVSGGGNKGIIINCQPSTTYTVSVQVKNEVDINVGSFATMPALGSIATVKVKTASSVTDKAATITTGASDNYLFVKYNNTNKTQTYSNQQVLDGLMAEVGSTASAYAPYSNICPISGWTGCNVTRTGKNLFDKNNAGWINGKLITADGSIVNHDTYRYCSTFFPILGGTNITISLNRTAGATANPMSFYDENKVFLERKSTISPDGSTGYLFATIQAPATAKYFRINDGINAGSTNIMIEHGSTASSYESYQGITYPITFPTEAGTVYGGTLDVTNGVLSVDRANIASYSGETLPGKWISDRDVYAAGTTPTTGAQVVYELATPIEITLTPTQITTLLGANNIWADCGPVSMDYPADTKLHIQKINAPTDDDMTADTQIASGKYFIIGNNLYLSTTTIPAGDTIIPGTNCQKTNLAEALNALNT